VNVRGEGLRRLAYGGARYGPRAFVEHSPALFGALFACLLPRERARIRESLSVARGERTGLAEHLDVLRTFVAYAHCLTESLAMERPEAKVAEPHVLGGDHLRGALVGGRGCVIVTAHTGAWDAAARWLVRDHGLDVMLVMAAETDAHARAFHDGLRARLGVRVAHVGGHPLDALPVLRHLRRGGVVAVQLDRIATRETSVPVTLGGRPFEVPAGPFHLAMHARVPIVPVFTRRLGYFRHEIHVRTPIFAAPSSGEAGVALAAAAATAEMERFLRENPTQWFHFSHAAKAHRTPG
jgi:phosphatidylinositol dimannoside acyltransferase